MTTDSMPAAPNTPADPATVAAKPPRVWPAALIVGAFWLSYLITTRLELVIFAQFFSRFIATALLILLFTAWWLLDRSISRTDRLWGLAAAFVGGLVVCRFADKSIDTMTVIMICPLVVFTVWTAWLLVARRMASIVRRRGLVAAILLAWGLFLLIRTQGIDGDGNVAIRWRWTETAEQRFLAERVKANKEQLSARPRGPSQPLVLQPGDWPGFRGPNRDGEMHGVKIATDWNSAPPKQLWRQRIGPAWSSVVIIGDRLFTQEQQGNFEAVVCLDAATGAEIWTHKDEIRYSDGQAGAGPRATPTFADGRIFTFGGKGTVNCLDAATGEKIWSRDIVADGAAEIPMWGFSSSPLVVNGLVVVYGGGKESKGLVAYRETNGEPAWTAVDKQTSYSSPQAASVDGESQILFLTDHGLTAVNSKSGAVSWEHVADKAGIWRAVQPRQVGEHQFIVGSEDLGLVLVDVAHEANHWTAKEQWSTRNLKPAYNDFVISDGAIYGFDGGIFACVDLKTGKRHWKEGRYGHGQVLLLADQRVLLVLSETGEAILLAANPDKPQELGRFQALEGKTWNHPVIAHGRLYVRNAEEIACYELKPLKAE